MACTGMSYATVHCTHAYIRALPSFCTCAFQVFCNLLDLAGINARVLYNGVTSFKLSRRAFIMQLVDEICADNESAAAPAAAVEEQHDKKSPQQCQVICAKGTRLLKYVAFVKSVHVESCSKNIPITCKKCFLCMNIHFHFYMPFTLRNNI